LNSVRSSGARITHSGDGRRLFAQTVPLSPDGAHVYAAGWNDDAVAVFARDAGTGALTFIEAQRDGVGGVDGLDGAFSVTLSPDGAHVYAAGQNDNAVVVFSEVSITAVPTGTDVGGSTLGGSGTPGGVDFVFDSVDPGGGDFTAQHQQTPLEQAEFLYNDPGNINFWLPSDPVQTWELDFVGGTFTGDVEITFSLRRRPPAAGLLRKRGEPHHLPLRGRRRLAAAG
jgi:hypothetical protein